MSEQNQAVSGGFIKAFIPGLIVGFVASTGGNVTALTGNNKPVPATHDRDGNVIDEARDAGEEAVEETGEAIDEGADKVEDAVDELKDELDKQTPPPANGDGGE